MMKRFLCSLIVFASLLSVGMGVLAQAPPPPKRVEEVSRANQVKASRYDPGDRRDPFLNPLRTQKRKTAATIDEEEDRGQPPPGIAGMYIAQVALLGTSIRDGAMVAVFQGTDKRAYFLREGDRLFDGHVKEIKGDRVVMVRTTRMKSGKVINQEVVKELRTQ
jgi:Tfp pilus assembly protein PilP